VTHIKFNYFPLLFISQPGAGAVITQEAKGGSGRRNLKWQLSQLKAQPDLRSVMPGASMSIEV